MMNLLRDQSSSSFPKRYQKAPVRYLWEKFQQEARVLRKIATLAFFMGMTLLFLANPFASLTFLKNLPKNIADFPDKQLMWRADSSQLLSSFPDFLQDFPKEFEKQSFVFFDWTATQLENFPIFAKEETITDAEAGSSALAELSPEPSPDPATLAFFIEIPKLNLYETVVSNVDPNKKSAYEAALKEGVAHSLGSAFPDQGKMIYIFGHSTDYAWNVSTYNAVFYQVKDLQIGDEIFLHLGDQDYAYRVISRDVIQGSDVDFVNKKIDENILLLQTCWPPGTSWQRIFVSAKPIALQDHLEKMKSEEELSTEGEVGLVTAPIAGGALASKENSTALSELIR